MIISNKIKRFISFIIIEIIFFGFPLTIPFLVPKQIYDLLGYIPLYLTGVIFMQSYFSLVELKRWREEYDSRKTNK